MVVLPSIVPNRQQNGVQQKRLPKLVMYVNEVLFSTKYLNILLSGD
jgi:hypothetical protein